MSLFTVDSNNTFGNGVAEAGKYNVKIVKADSNQAQSTGNTYISIDYQVLDGKYKGGEIRYQSLTWDNNNVEMSVKRFNTLAVAIGVKDGVQIDSVAQFAKAIVGKVLSINVDWGEPNNKGNIYLTVRGYGKLDENGSQPNGVKRPSNKPQASPDIVDSFNNAVKGMGQPQPKGDPFASNPFANNGDAVDISDDDLPF